MVNCSLDCPHPGASPHPLPEGEGGAYLHLQPYRPHELQCVALLDDARVQEVVENHPAIDQLVLEVKVRGARCERIGKLCEGEVVGCHETDCASIDQAPN